jgi:small-conductance mechanosensitive channel/CRP-like cAMP-binding protein
VDFHQLVDSYLTSLVAMGLLVACAILGLALSKGRVVRRHMGAALVAFTLFGVVQLVRFTLELGDLDRFLRLAGYLAVTYGALRVLLSLTLDVLLRRQGRTVPQIVRQVTFGGLYVLVVLVLMSEAFGVNLGSLLATSAILSLVVGLALQETLGNVFAGLSIQAEKPFEVGEWITFGEETGRIVQIGWRTTQIETFSLDLVSVPNNVLAREIVLNHNRPVHSTGQLLQLRLSFDAPPNRVKDVVRDVLAAEPRVARSPEPVVRFLGFEDHWATYRVRFWIEEMSEKYVITDALYTALWYRLRREGLEVPLPIRNVTVRQIDDVTEAREKQVQRRRILELLRRSDLLAPLSSEDLEILADRGREVTFGADEIVFRAGEAGETCFLVLEGNLLAESREGHIVSELHAGEIVGEGALLTGEARTATVRAHHDSRVLEIGRDAFGKILLANQTVADDLATILENRRLRFVESPTLSRAAGVEAFDERSAGTSRLLAKIREIFGLGT